MTLRTLEGAPISPQVGDCYTDLNSGKKYTYCRMYDGYVKEELRWVEESNQRPPDLVFITAEEAFAIIGVLDQFKGHDYVLNTLARQIEVQALAAKSNRETKDERPDTKMSEV